MMTSLVFSLLREMKLNVREMHYKKPPVYRSRVSVEFKEAKQGILVTSDLSSRGLNYPGVSLVIQVIHCVFVRFHFMNNLLFFPQYLSLLFFSCFAVVERVMLYTIPFIPFSCLFHLLNS